MAKRKRIFTAAEARGIAKNTIDQLIDRQADVVESMIAESLDIDVEDPTFEKAFDEVYNAIYEVIR
jgi:lambda repressor-like predicted transcriptional regulator